MLLFVEFKLLGVRIDSIPRSELGRIFEEKLSGRKFCQVATVNPEFLVTAKADEKFRKILNHTELNLCDGVGITIVSRWLHGKKIPRIAGVDVARQVCKSCAVSGKSVFFLGGWDVAEAAAAQAKKWYPNLRVAGTADGHPGEINDAVAGAEPDAILVAFGSPAQEQWLAAFGKKIPSLRIGVGVGGTFDFWAGKVKRAPVWMQKIGIEWMWRLIQNPRIRTRRIWRAVGEFPLLALSEKFSAKN